MKVIPMGLDKVFVGSWFYFSVGSHCFCLIR